MMYYHLVPHGHLGSTLFAIYSSNYCLLSQHRYLLSQQDLFMQDVFMIIAAFETQILICNKTSISYKINIYWATQHISHPVLLFLHIRRHLFKNFPLLGNASIRFWQKREYLITSEGLDSKQIWDKIDEL